MSDDMRRQTPSEKVYSTDKAREKIEADTARFLAGGKQIAEIAMGQGVEDYSTVSQKTARRRGNKASREARR